MRHVVVAENLLLAVRLAHALDHRIVIQRVRQDQAVRHQSGQRGDAGLVGDVAGREHQRRFLAVQVGELALKLDQGMIVAGDVAGAAGAGSHPRRGLDHGADHLRVLAHAEVVVRAPDHDILRPLRRMPNRIGKAAGDPLQIGKDPVTPLAATTARARRQKSRRSSWRTPRESLAASSSYRDGNCFKQLPDQLNRASHHALPLLHDVLAP